MSCNAFLAGLLLLGPGACSPPPAGEAAVEPASAPASPPATRLLVIALDGADWDRFRPMMEQGRLPSIAGLVRRGAVGRIALEAPGVPPATWTTMVTGRPADEHHVLDATRLDPVSGETHPVRSSDRGVKALWNILDEADRTSAVVGWWGTAPAEPVKGVVVSDLWPSATATPPAGEIAHIAPPELAAEIDRLRVDPGTLGATSLRRFVPLRGRLREILEGRAPAIEDGVEHPVAQIRRIVADTASRENAAVHALRTVRPDLALVYFPGIDAVERRFARFEPPRLPGVSPADAARYAGVVDAFHGFQDEVVGRLLRAAGPDMTVILVSGHGFARTSGMLRRNPGLLVLAGEPFTSTPLGDVRAADLAPTLLVALGLPVAEDFGGRPLLSAFDQSFLGRHPVSTRRTWEDGRPHRRLDEQPAERLGAVSWTHLAQVHAAAGRLREARRAYEKALQQDPAALQARHGLFDTLVRSGAIDDAMAQAARLLAADRSPASYRVVTRFWLANGAIDAARENLQRMEDRGAGPPLARGLLARAEDRLDEAEAELRVALEREPGSWEAVEELLRLYEDTGRIEAAREPLRQGLAAHGGYSVPHLLALGHLALGEEDLEAAGDYLARAEEIAPAEPEVHLYSGSLLYRQGRYLEAASAFAHVLEGDPDHLDARKNQILSLARSGRIAQALQTFRDAGPENRAQPALLNAAAYACLVNGLQEEGRPLVQRSLAVDPANPETLALAADYQARPGEETVP